MVLSHRCAYCHALIRAPLRATAVRTASGLRQQNFPTNSIVVRDVLKLPRDYAAHASQSLARRAFSSASFLRQQPLPAVNTKGKAREIPDLSQFPPERIRNMSIIAHIDHGKSTLADRLLELTGTIPPKARTTHGGESEKNEQVLDTLKVERERGITVRAQSASMFYTHTNGEQYLVNLLDTPGHTDFSSEVLRSLLASQGAILLVDASQGVQAQTLSVLDAAQKRGLKVIGAVNKWDLVQGDERGPMAVQELAELIDCQPEEVLKISAKTGLGVESVLEAVVDRLPAPPSATDSDEPFSALVFDNHHDAFRGVVSLIAVAGGTISRGDNITSIITKKSYPVLDLGLLCPHEVSISDHPSAASRSLRKGQVGYVVCSMKDVRDAHLGDTFHHSNRPVAPLESFKPPKSSVFCGIYPLEQGGFPNLEEAIKRLTLTDRSVGIQRESSSFLGQGFRLGFNGSLHMDVFRQRLEDEYGEEVIVTRPLVPVKLEFRDGTERIIDNPADFPDSTSVPNTSRSKLAQVYEPTIRVTIVAPDEYTGAIISLCTANRGVPISQAYLSEAAVASSSTTAASRRVSHVYSLPLSAVITSFHSNLKSVTSGFASFDYEEGEYEPSDLVRMNILVNSVKVDALCTVIHRSLVEKEGREWAKRLREAIPRQQFEIIIQAAVGQTIVARERIQPVRKDVTAGMYGGDYTRKMKKLVKQREGKKRLKERSIGRVSIPTEAFYTVLGGPESRRKKS